MSQPASPLGIAMPFAGRRSSIGGNEPAYYFSNAGEHRRTGSYGTNNPYSGSPRAVTPSSMRGLHSKNGSQQSLHRVGSLSEAGSGPPSPGSFRRKPAPAIDPELEAALLAAGGTPITNPHESFASSDSYALPSAIGSSAGRYTPGSDHMASPVSPGARFGHSPGAVWGLVPGENGVNVIMPDAPVDLLSHSPRHSPVLQGPRRTSSRSGLRNDGTDNAPPSPSSRYAGARTSTSVDRLSKGYFPSPPLSSTKKFFVPTQTEPQQQYNSMATSPLATSPGVFPAGRMSPKLAASSVPIIDRPPDRSASPSSSISSRRSGSLHSSSQQDLLKNKLPSPIIGARTSSFDTKQRKQAYLSPHRTSSISSLNSSVVSRSPQYSPTMSNKTYDLGRKQPPAMDPNSDEPLPPSAFALAHPHLVGQHGSSRASTASLVSDNSDVWEEAPEFGSELGSPRRTSLISMDSNPANSAAGQTLVFPTAQQSATLDEYNEKTPMMASQSMQTQQSEAMTLLASAMGSTASASTMPVAHTQLWRDVPEPALISEEADPRPSQSSEATAVPREAATVPTGTSEAGQVLLPPGDVDSTVYRAGSTPPPQRLPLDAPDSAVAMGEDDVKKKTRAFSPLRASVGRHSLEAEETEASDIVAPLPRRRDAAQARTLVDPSGELDDSTYAGRIFAGPPRTRSTSPAASPALSRSGSAEPEESRNWRQEILQQAVGASFAIQTDDLAMRSRSRSASRRSPKVVSFVEPHDVETSVTSLKGLRIVSRSEPPWDPSEPTGPVTAGSLPGSSQNSPNRSGIRRMFSQDSQTSKPAKTLDFDSLGRRDETIRKTLTSPLLSENADELTSPEGDESREDVEVLRNGNVAPRPDFSTSDPTREGRNMNASRMALANSTSSRPDFDDLAPAVRDSEANGVRSSRSSLLGMKIGSSFSAAHRRTMSQESQSSSILQNLAPASSSSIKTKARSKLTNPFASSKSYVNPAVTPSTVPYVPFAPEAGVRPSAAQEYAAQAKAAMAEPKTATSTSRRMSSSSSQQQAIAPPVTTKRSDGVAKLADLFAQHQEAEKARIKSIAARETGGISQQ
ncbi:uncharacterized protein L969DRAFT_43724 [Mixia osmundae IAM 14324]|uniref:Uncharacterized protein n=1 Tax=Mixia osmundae (strain CBS 9802 / IAM 14324 / JCM 22182 / KY 12970) TaxID=764103 RepID=G7E367_MIXOS|nr:uncharacterized protein L969DRAFT_43724 [Mixia osmundae IAM 14324]KEI42463.1 hypothetical protein L969DRAFT_43724 [Mixia osmundae IAM 14324]GAA97248.1 hypothetical protein E5Q_03925 [Mixia osmundae IAM 14324]